MEFFAWIIMFLSSVLNFSIANYRRVLDKPKLGAGIKCKILTFVKQCSILRSKAMYLLWEEKDK